MTYRLKKYNLIHNKLRIKVVIIPLDWPLKSLNQEERIKSKRKRVEDFLTRLITSKAGQK